MKTGISIATIPPILILATPAIADDGSGQLGLLTAFAGGIMTAFTPCVYPIIPLLLAQAGNGTQKTKKTAALHSAVLIAGMILVYAILGVIAGLSNIIFGQWTASPYFTIATTGLMWFFAAGLLGVYSFQLPQSVTSWANRLGGRGFTGAFLTGTVSGVLTAGCTGPVLAGILTYIAASHSSTQSVALMVTFATGMGIPFFIFSIAVFALPKPGQWMMWVEGVLGILLFGVGAWFATRNGSLSNLLSNLIHPAVWTVIGGATVIIGAAVWIRHVRFGQTRNPKVSTIFAASCMAAGTTLFMASMYGGPPPANKLKWIEVATETAYLEQVAQHRGTPILVDFHAEWCADCKTMERTVLHQSDIASLIDTHFVAIRVDATSNMEAVKPIARRFDVQGVPAFRFLDKEGKELRKQRLNGPATKDWFRSLLQQAITASGKNRDIAPQ